MKKRRLFYSELAYLIGIFALAVGTAFAERADFGLSMVVAPAYLVHLKVSEYLPFFTFGMAEYTLQALLLVILALIMRRFRVSYLFSFVTALFYGLTLDLLMLLISFFPGEAILMRLIFHILGLLLCSIGVSLLFHSYISPEAYELFVKELSFKLGKDINRVKTAYDISSCLIAVVLSFIFYGFGHFEGVKFGTVFCALINGTLIGLISCFFEKRFEFVDRVPLSYLFAAKESKKENG